MDNTFINEILKTTTSISSSIIKKELLIDRDKSTPITLMYSESTVDKDIINRDILNPIMNNFNVLFPKDIDKYEFLIKVALPVCNTKIETSLSEISNALSSGKTIIIFDGYRKSIIIDTTSFTYRSISEPTDRKSVV